MSATPDLPQLEPAQPLTPNPQHDNPQHDSPQHVNGQDDELPPSARTTTGKSAKGKASVQQQESRATRRRWIKRGVLGAVLIGALAFLMRPATESTQPNWRHHNQATQHFEDGDANGLKWVSDMGPARFVDGIVVSGDDIDVDTTTQLLRSRWDPNRENEVLQDAQEDLEDAEAVFAGLADKPDQAPVKPSLSQGMRAEIAKGDSRCFHIFLYDSCVHDGDIVEIIIDGHRFATVPITKQGTTLSIPLSMQSQIAIRGIFDGGGGITVACQTSQGEGFVRVLAVGEEQLLGVIGK